MNLASAGRQCDVLFLLAGLVAGASFTSCQQPASVNSRDLDVSVAERLGTQFYKLQQRGDNEASAALYNDERSLDRARRRFIVAATDSLGPVKDFTLESWQPIRRESSGLGPGYELTYQVIRSRRVARETLDIVETGDSVRIHGYHIEVNGVMLAENPAAVTDNSLH
jgi:hypothetical protein